uniref:Uncharacterized protein n=1 Tax=Lepeophtheirus salmonis TaxID=72036 RepID=A0A0K2U1P4_LEPSM
MDPEFVLTLLILVFQKIQFGIKFWELQRKTFLEPNSIPTCHLQKDYVSPKKLGITELPIEERKKLFWHLWILSFCRMRYRSLNISIKKLSWIFQKKYLLMIPASNVALYSLNQYIYQKMIASRITIERRK